jgi:tryptophanyl-tRNA synthetase
MGKIEGEGNAIFLSDTPEVIRKKVMRAVTDVALHKITSQNHRRSKTCST